MQSNETFVFSIYYFSAHCTLPTSFSSLRRRVSYSYCLLDRRDFCKRKKGRRATNKSSFLYVAKNIATTNIGSFLSSYLSAFLSIKLGFNRPPDQFLSSLPFSSVPLKYFVDKNRQRMNPPERKAASDRPLTLTGTYARIRSRRKEKQKSGLHET